MAPKKESSSTLSSAADRELTVSRLLHAPRKLVWEVWTNPEHIKNWWGPNGFTTTIFKMDVQPGGAWDLTLHGPDGTDYKNNSVFKEIIPFEKIVYDHISAPQFIATVIFTEKGDQTQVDIQMLFETAEQKDNVIKTFGADEGLKQNIDKLASYLDKAFPGGTLITTRLVNAPRELVWEVWTQPEHVQNWWGPDGFTNTIHEMEVKPGGIWRFLMHGPNGMEFPNKIVFHKVEKPECLEYTHSSDDKNDLASFKTTVTFEDQGGKTRITLKTQFGTAEDRNRVIKEYGALEGGKQTLSKLEVYVQSQFDLRKKAKISAMARTSTYLNFPGNTEEVFRYYQSIFGGEFIGPGVQRFGDLPPQEGMPLLSDTDKKMILHIELAITGGHVLMGTDAPESMGFKVILGNNVHLNLEPDTRKEAKRLFDALSAGGIVTMPLQDMFWGAYFGSCTDKFGINWMVNCTEAKN